MKKRGSADHDDDDDGDERKAPAGAVPRAADLSETNVKEEDFTEEFPSELPSIIEMPSASSGSPPYASLPSVSEVQDDDGRDFGHGSARGTQILERAPPSEAIPASSHHVTPGAYRVSSSRNTATSRAFMAPMSSYDSTTELTSEESKQEEEVPNTAGAHTSGHNSSSMAAGSGLYTVEALLVSHGNEEEMETMMVAEAQYVRIKWYQRRWFFAVLALFACGLVGAVVGLVVNRPPSAGSTSSLTSSSPVPTTAPPASLTPEQVA